MSFDTNTVATALQSPKCPLL